MDSKDIILVLNKIIEVQDISVASVARRMNKSTQALSKQLNNKDMKISTLLEIIEALHCDININFTDRATNKEYHIK